MPGIPISSGLVDFAVGAALITLPQFKVPLAVGAASLTLVKRWKGNKSGGENTGAGRAHSGQVRLHWSDIVCSITSKKGAKKELLRGISGEATPGR